jgi:hypothetical protein
VSGDITRARTGTVVWTAAGWLWSGHDNRLGAAMAMEGRRRTSRARHVWRTGAAATAACTIVLGAAGALVAGAAGADAASDPSVTIVQTPLVDEGACVPSLIGRGALSYRRESTGDHFRLTIVNHWHLCQPVTATAVVYGMPGGATAWPQRLIERVPFAIEVPSTTVITFAKGCVPAQFDVVTGATPGAIDVLPAGPTHGPLLFPGDLATAEQYFGTNCGPGATTTIPITSTTEVPPVVEGTTTVPSPASTTSTSTTSTTVPGTAATTVPGSGGGGGDGTPNPDVDVSPAVATRATPSSASAADSPLALTGAQSLMVATLGALLLAVGAGLVVAARRARRDPTYWPLALADPEGALPPPVPGLFSTRPVTTTIHPALLPGADAPSAT